MTRDVNRSLRDQRKTVLIVGPDFTPSSYPPALRIRFFAQHLREFGWEPIVLTTDPGYYEWEVDPENEKLLPQTDGQPANRGPPHPVDLQPLKRILGCVHR